MSLRFEVPEDGVRPAVDPFPPCEWCAERKLPGSNGDPRKFMLWISEGTAGVTCSICGHSPNHDPAELEMEPIAVGLNYRRECYGDSRKPPGHAHACDCTWWFEVSVTGADVVAS